MQAVWSIVLKYWLYWMDLLTSGQFDTMTLTVKYNDGVDDNKY